MKAIKIILCISVLGCAALVKAQDIDPADVKAVMQKMADWQIEHINDLYSGREAPHHPLGW